MSSGSSVEYPWSSESGEPGSADHRLVPSAPVGHGVEDRRSQTAGLQKVTKTIRLLHDTGIANASLTVGPLRII